MIHNRVLVSLIALVSVGAFACASQPVGPSESSAASGTPTAAATSAKGGRPAAGGVIYVISQGLFFSTFASAETLPMEGPFQLLADTDGDGISETQYGPGDPGYLGGRWWVDDGDGVQDAGDTFFLCPLIPPGRPTP